LNNAKKKKEKVKPLTSQKRLAFSFHAKKRLEKRGIRQQQCEALFQHGRRCPARDGCTQVYDRRLKLIVDTRPSPSIVVTAYWIGVGGRRAEQINNPADC
jgi:hypothetical protein